MFSSVVQPSPPPPAPPYHVDPSRLVQVERRVYSCLDRAEEEAAAAAAGRASTGETERAQAAGGGDSGGDDGGDVKDAVKVKPEMENTRGDEEEVMGMGWLRAYLSERLSGVAGAAAAAAVGDGGGGVGTEEDVAAAAAAATTGVARTLRAIERWVGCPSCVYQEQGRLVCFSKEGRPPIGRAV